MSTMLNYLKQFLSVLSIELPRITDVDATYLRVYPNMVCLVDNNSSTRIFIIPEVMECFTYIYPNRYCSVAQFRDFSRIINIYIDYQLHSVGLFNELKNEQIKNETPVCWYFVATIPIFEEPEESEESEEPEQHIEENDNF